MNKTAAEAQTTYANYIQDISRYPLLSKERTRELIARKDTDPNARAELINCNLRLVVYIVKYTNCKGVDVMDLIMAGNEYLIHGIDLFKPEFNTELSTYVVPWIKQAIHRAIVNQGRSIRIPLETSDLISKLQAFISAYNRDHGEEPDEERCAQELNITVKKVRDLKEWSRPVSSIDTVISTDEGEGNTIGDFLSDSNMVHADTEPSSDSISQLIDNHALSQVFGVLDPREKLVLMRRFGLCGVEEWTLAQIAQELNITKETVRQIQIRALKKLRAEIEH